MEEKKNKLVELYCIEKGVERKSLSKDTSEHRFPEMEVILDAWVCEVRTLGYSVTQSNISQMSLKFLEELNIPHEGFKANFYREGGLSFRRVSTLNPLFHRIIIKRWSGLSCLLGECWKNIEGQRFGPVMKPLCFMTWLQNLLLKRRGKVK